MNRWNPLRIRSWSRNEGATIVLVAVGLVAFMSVAALAVDIGYLMVARNELQNAADSAALAAARYIGRTLQGKTQSQQQSYQFTQDAIAAVAADAATKNTAGGTSVTLAAADIVVGNWDSSRPAGSRFYNPGNMIMPDAVQVTTRRDSVQNGPLLTFFARVFGATSMATSATATAALTGESTVGPGGLPVPVGISKAWFNPNSCNQNIQFSPTGSLVGCAGWTLFDTSNVNDNDEKRLLPRIENGTFQSPPVVAGTTQFSFIGGNLSNPTFDNFKSLFDSMKVKNDGVLDADNDPNTWTTVVVVYNMSDCSNPNSTYTIVGFATAVISNVDVHAKIIDAKVICNMVDEGRSGGGAYGTKGSIPGLVQ